MALEDNFLNLDFSELEAKELKELEERQEQEFFEDMVLKYEREKK